MAIKSMPLAQLVEDMDLYPRHAVDQANVQALALALQSGCNLPPIVADKRSKRIVDGWHRYRAYRRVLGDEGVVDVDLISYRSEADILLDAVRRNASHGRKLDVIDQTRAVIMLEKSGFARDKIALALNVPPERITKLSVRVATAQSPAPAKGCVTGTEKVSLKRPVAHMKDRELTAEQIEVHNMLPGTSFLLVSRQLRRALEVDLVDLTDEKLLEELLQLRGALQAKLP